MAEKTLKTRIQHKHDLQENWEKATGFVPLAGELIIYDVDSEHSTPRFKIGDGVIQDGKVIGTNVNDLPFAEMGSGALDPLTEFWDGTVATAFAGGAGTKTDPYLIQTPSQLALMLELFGDNGKYFKLMNDLYMANMDYFFFDEYDEYDIPMWYNTTYIEGTAYVYENKKGNRGAFNGYIDGNNKTIYCLYSEGVIGAFIPVFANGEIKNLKIDWSIFKGSSNAAVFIGRTGRDSYPNGEVLIDRCISGKFNFIENLSDTTGCGGFVGYATVNNTTTIQNSCSFTPQSQIKHGRQQWKSNGIIGETYNSSYKIYNCFSVAKPFDTNNEDIRLSQADYSYTKIYSTTTRNFNYNEIGTFTKIEESDAIGTGALTTMSLYNFVEQYKDYPVISGFDAEAKSSQIVELNQKIENKQDKFAEVTKDGEYTPVITINTSHGNAGNASITFDHNDIDITAYSGVEILAGNADINLEALQGKANYNGKEIATKEDIVDSQPTVEFETIGTSVNIEKFDTKDKLQVLRGTGCYNIDNWDGSVATGFDVFEGAGTKTDPYLIDSGAKLNYAIRNNNTYKYFRITRDIDLSAYHWFEPWYPDTRFVGEIDGNNHVITGMQQTNYSYYSEGTEMFSADWAIGHDFGIACIFVSQNQNWFNGRWIESVELTNISIDSGTYTNYEIGIVKEGKFYAMDHSEFKSKLPHSYPAVAVVGNDSFVAPTQVTAFVQRIYSYYKGLIPWAGEVEVKNLILKDINIADGNAPYRCGGLIGCHDTNGAVTISNCLVTGNASYCYDFGGIIGGGQYGAIITNCGCDITYTNIGHRCGLIGDTWNDAYTVTNCYSNDAIAGNIAGDETKYTNCYAGRQVGKSEVVIPSVMMTGTNALEYMPKLKNNFVATANGTPYPKTIYEAPVSNYQVVIGTTDDGGGYYNTDKNGYLNIRKPGVISVVGDFALKYIDSQNDTEKFLRDNTKNIAELMQNIVVPFTKVEHNLKAKDNFLLEPNSTYFFSAQDAGNNAKITLYVPNLNKPDEVTYVNYSYEYMMIVAGEDNGICKGYYIGLEKGDWSSFNFTNWKCHIIDYTSAGEKRQAHVEFPANSHYYMVSSQPYEDLVKKVINNSAEEQPSTPATKSEKKRYLLISDSYGRAPGNQPQYTGWAPLFKERMGLSDEDCIINTLSGSAFLTGNTPFINLLSTSTNSKGTATVEGFPVSNPETLTDIIICGGYNEWHHQDQIAAKIQEFMAKAKELYPNAQVSIGMVGTEVGASKSSKVWNLAAVTLNGYKGIDYYTGLPYRYLNNLEYVLRTNPEYMLDNSDTVHPTQKGYEALANAICKAVNGGYVPGHSEYEVSLSTPNENIILDENTKLKVTLDNSVAKISCDTLSVSFTNGVDTSSSEIEIAALDTAHSLISGNNSDIEVQGMVNTNGQYHMFTSKLRIADGKIYITPRLNHINNTISSIELYGIQIIAPANCY